MPIIRHRAVAALALAVALAAPLSAQQPAAFTPGRVSERVASQSEPARSYALYLPAAYTTEKTWPVLFLMDPRGRAMVPLELFREAAERHGWVLMSSYHTLSDADSATEVNDASLNSMLLDAQQRLSLDTRRLYLGGFSGTARHAWGAAIQLDGHLAGIVAVGAGFPSPAFTWRTTLPTLKPFAVFGTAGDTDFNHDEMLAVDSLLEEIALPHRTVFFPGVHQWPTKPVATEALEWLQLHAMKTGLAPRDEGWIDSLLAARRRHAAALSGADALREHRSLAADFTGLRDVADVEARRDALAADRAVQREIARRSGLAGRYRDYNRKVHTFLDELGKADRMPPVSRGVEALEVERLLREAADSTDVVAMKAAQRMVALAMVWTAGYGLRQYMEKRDFTRAVAVLRIAERIRPRDPGVCYSLARALAQQGESAPALEYLACAAESGRLPAATVAGDRLLDPIRSEARFTEITAKIPNG
jgi:predicted esterase